MPKRREPITLTRACMQTITLSFDAICYGPLDLETMRELLEKGTYRDVAGPFLDWPGGVLYEILEAISERYTLNKKHLHMLIQPQLQSINLSFGMGDIVSGFPLIQERCKNLKHLQISYLRHLHPKSLIDLLPCVTNLLSLDLRMTLVSDEAIKIIGKSLKELAYLNLSGTSITDKGIIRLAIGEDGTHLSQKLSRLIISETWVSFGGAALLLAYLPELREFEYEKILEALELVYNWCPDLEQSLLNRCGARMKEVPTTNPTSMKLSIILSSADYITDNTLEAAITICPNISSFSISNARVTNEQLYKLMVLDKLTTLSLTNSESQTIDFEAGVLPILSACGENIKNLILTNFTFVSLPDIGRTCPKIQNIAFSRIAIFYIESPCSEWFNHLEAMELWAEPHAEINPNIIKQLVAYSPDIKNLLFNSCDALTDELFSEIVEENPMKCLSHLTLDHCYYISVATLNSVLDSENDLSVLRVWSCPNVTKDNRVAITLRILQENMEVYFDWYEYTD